MDTEELALLKTKMPFVIEVMFEQGLKRGLIKALNQLSDKEILLLVRGPIEASEGIAYLQVATKFGKLALNEKEEDGQFFSELLNKGKGKYLEMLNTLKEMKEKGFNP